MARNAKRPAVCLGCARFRVAALDPCHAGRQEPGNLAAHGIRQATRLGAHHAAQADLTGIDKRRAQRPGHRGQSIVLRGAGPGPPVQIVKKPRALVRDNSDPQIFLVAIVVMNARAADPEVFGQIANAHGMMSAVAHPVP